MLFKSESTQGDLNGFIDRGSELRGELHFENNFRVDGRIVGSIVSEGSLVVGDHGEVEGEVRVGRVFVAGTVKGTVEAGRQVQIAPGGKVYADLSTPSLVIEDGAVFEGHCTMGRRKTASPPATSGGEAPAGEGDRGRGTNPGAGKAAASGSGPTRIA